MIIKMKQVMNGKKETFAVFLIWPPERVRHIRDLVRYLDLSLIHIFSLLMSKNIEAFDSLLAKIKEYNFKLYQYIIDYLHSDKKILPIIIQGGNSSLSQSFLSAMQRTLELSDLADLMPDTHFTAAIEMIDSWEEKYPETYEKLKAELNEPISCLLYTSRCV